MKIIEVIGKGFSLAGKNIGLLTVLFIVNAAWNLGALPFVGNAPNMANFKLKPQTAILGVLFIFLNIFIQGGMLGILKDALESNGRAALNNFSKYGAKFYLRFLGLGLIIITGLLLAALIIALIFSISLVVKSLILKIIVTAIAIILSLIALYYLFLFFFSPYALVVDDAGIFKAMGSSLRFIKSHFWMVTWLTTLLLLIALGIGFLVGIVIGIISLGLKGAALQIVTAVISSGVNAYITVIISVALMVYYFVLSDAGKKKETEQPSVSA